MNRTLPLNLSTTTSKKIGPEWARDHAQQLFEEYYDEAVRDFTEGRLKSFYLSHPTIAAPAASAAQYARELLPEHAPAALLFAAISVELTWRVVVLKPLVAGIVHVDSLAEDIVERAIPMTGGIERFKGLLPRVLKETTRVDFMSYRQPGQPDLLRDEINRIAKSRNQMMHAGVGCAPETASIAVDVADHMLLQFLPKLLDAIGLRIDGTCIIHESTRLRP